MKIRSLKQVLLISLPISALFFIYPEILLKLFNVANPNYAEVVSLAIRITAFSLVGRCISYLLVNYAQAIEQNRISSIITFMEEFVFAVGGALILTRAIGGIGIWFSILIVECVPVLKKKTINNRENKLNLRESDSMIGNEWDKILKEEFQKDYFIKTMEFVEEEYRTKTIYPPKEDIFNAFRLCPIDDVKVVILGQDPYHEEGQAHGLAFSTPEGHPIPRSLKNIFKEIQDEYDYPIPDSGCLESWAKQGVFLLNTVLTVEEGNANSHSKCGWQTFTDNVIRILNQLNQPIAFLLWGKQAENKKELITNPNHLVLVSSHPSPFSARRGFFGCNHFKLANEFLKNNNLEEIDWQIKNRQTTLL